MTKKSSKHDYSIRHRLVGAIALMALGIVFIPMILAGKDPGNTVRSNGLKEEVHEFITGSEEAKTYISRVKPVESGEQTGVLNVDTTDQSTASLAIIDDTQTDELPVADTSKAEQAEQAALEPEKPKAEPVVETASEPEPIPEPKEVASLKPEKVDRGWIVQVGTFSKSVNAQNLISKLNKNGFDPRYEVIQTDSGQATRVWVGPYSKRVDAAHSVSVVQEKTGVKGFIKSFP